MDDVTAALRDMGEVIRAGAARRAGWSERIPGSGHVEAVRPGEVLVVFGGPAAPNAYPFEVKGVRHPVFATGPRRRGPWNPVTHRYEPPGWHWVPNDWRPFLAPAAQEDSDKALFEFARVVDKWGHDLGFTGTG